MPTAPQQLALRRLQRPARLLLDQVLVDAPAGNARTHADVAVVGRQPLRIRHQTEFMLMGPDAGLPQLTRRFEVVIALDLLAVATDPQASLRQVADAATRHLVVAAPRSPLGWVSGFSRAWSSPSLLRLLSRFGAIREVRHPLPWTLVWVRRH